MKIRLLALLLLLAFVCTGFSSCFVLFGGEKTEFSDSEREAMKNAHGFELPFLNCAQYEFNSEDDRTLYMAMGFSEEDYNNYINNVLPEKFVFLGERLDYYGDVWYEYTYLGWNITVGKTRVMFMEYMDVYLYPSSHNVAGVKSNANAGLPTGENGLLTLDFSAAEYPTLKSLSYNKYACPSVGDVNVLVLPVCFKSDTAKIKLKLNISELGEIFNGTDGVAEYFRESSFGKLNMHFDVYPELFEAPYSADELFSEYSVNDILLSALSSLEDSMDLTKYDSDGDGCIDSVVMVNTLDMNDENLVQWAFKSQNYITSSTGDGYFFDGKGVSNYVWLSSDFLYDDAGPSIETLVHEITHTMGVPDYYATDYWFAEDPVFGLDIMSGTMMDHSPFTKFALGWITEATLVTDLDEAEISLGNFWETGEVLIVSNDFDTELGCFQEYYVLMYSVGEPAFRDGLVVYHINSSIIEQRVYNRTETWLYNNNDACILAGSEDNLIELVGTKDIPSTPLDTSTSYSLSVLDDEGEPLQLQFYVPRKSAGRVFLQFEEYGTGEGRVELLEQ